MKDEAAELAFRILIYIFGVFLLVISLAILPFKMLLHSLRQERRSNAMALKARELGLMYRKESDRHTAGAYTFLDQFEKQSGSRESYSLNTIKGDFDGRSVTLFDFHFLSDETVWWWAPSWNRHCYFSFIVLNLEKGFPELTLAKEGIFSKIAQALGFDDIDFESHEFSRHYKVHCNDKKFAYDFCNAKMIGYLLDQPVIAIEIERNALALGFDSQYKVEKIGRHLTHLVKVRSFMPNYLFDKRAGGQ